MKRGGPYQSGAANVPAGTTAAGRAATNSHRIVDTARSSLAGRGKCLLRMVVALVVGGTIGAGTLIGQPLRQPDILQVGPAGLPGVGFQIGYVEAGPSFTREALAYVNLAPRFGSDREALHVSAGLGAGVRIIGLLQTLTLMTPRAWDVHLGFRFGPGLSFSADEDRGDKNQRFSLFLEPFVRFTTGLGGTQVYFFEAGINRPALRAGVWLGI